MSARPGAARAPPKAAKKPTPIATAIYASPPPLPSLPPPTSTPPTNPLVDRLLGSDDQPAGVNRDPLPYPVRGQYHGCEVQCRGYASADAPFDYTPSAWSVLDPAWFSGPRGKIDVEGIGMRLSPGSILDKAASHPALPPALAGADAAVFGLAPDVNLALTAVLATATASQLRTATGEPTLGGFSRPSVLVLCGTRHRAAALAETIATLVPVPGLLTKVTDKDKNGNNVVPPSQLWAERWADTPETDAEDQRRRDLGRPEDFVELYAGRTDSNFNLGIGLSVRNDRVTRVKMVPNLTTADILVTSPTALSKLIGTSKESADASFRKKHPFYDLLTSISLVIVDQTSLLEDQSFEHLSAALDALNRPPTTAADFSTTRQSLLADCGDATRQTIFLGHHLTPQLRSLVSCTARAERAVILTTAPAQAGVVLRDVSIPVRYAFHLVGSTDTSGKAAAAAAAERVDKVMELIEAMAQEGSKTPATLVYVQSYYDFATIQGRLAERAGLKKFWGAVSEHTDAKEAARFREQFASGKLRLLFVTGRQHTLKRYRWKGLRRLICVGVPTYRHYLPELLAGGKGSLQCLIFFIRVEASLLTCIADKELVSRALGGPVTVSVNQLK